MGWMGREQVRLLLESGGLGLLLGVLFDVCCALSRACGGRRWLRFGVDAAFGVPAALLTFYGALAIMDGRMHPLLFAGLAVGFWLQHRTVGRWVSRWLYRAGRMLGRGIRALVDGVDAGCDCLGRRIRAGLRRKRRCGAADGEPSSAENKKKKKIHIFTGFFQKTS